MIVYEVDYLPVRNRFLYSLIGNKISIDKLISPVSINAYELEFDLVSNKLIPQVLDS